MEHFPQMIQKTIRNFGLKDTGDSLFPKAFSHPVVAVGGPLLDKLYNTLARSNTTTGSSRRWKTGGHRK
jgi:hypothetical protein